MGHALRFTEEGLAALLKRRDASTAQREGIGAQSPGSIPTAAKRADPVVRVGIVGKWMELPLPPPSNNLYATAKIKGVERRVLSKRGRQFKRAVVSVVRIMGQVRKIKGRVRVTMIVHPPNRRRMDIANREKALCDSFTRAGVWVDDSQSDCICIYRGVIVGPNGKLRVLVEEVDYKPLGINEVP